MEELTWKQKVKAYLIERAKDAPRILLVTALLSVGLAIAYYLVMTFVSLLYMK